MLFFLGLDLGCQHAGGSTEGEMRCEGGTVKLIWIWWAQLIDSICTIQVIVGNFLVVVTHRRPYI